MPDGGDPRLGGTSPIEVADAPDVSMEDRPNPALMRKVHAPKLRNSTVIEPQVSMHFGAVGNMELHLLVS